MKVENNMGKKIIRGLVSIASFLLFWELSVRLSGINQALISMPSKILAAGHRLLLLGDFWFHFFITVKALLVGFSLAVFIGVVLGVIIGHERKYYDYLNIHIIILNAIPIVSIIPLAIIWFGIGLPLKIFVVFFMALVPILISTIDGIRNVDNGLLLMAKSFGFGKIKILKSVTFFSSLPFIFSGMRMAVGKAVIGIVIAEVFGYGEGIGYLMTYYSSQFMTSEVLFLLFVLIFLNLAGIYAIRILERKTHEL